MFISVHKLYDNNMASNSRMTLLILILCLSAICLVFIFNNDINYVKLQVYTGSKIHQSIDDNDLGTNEIFSKSVTESAEVEEAAEEPVIFWSNRIEELIPQGE